MSFTVMPFENYKYSAVILFHAIASVFPDHSSPPDMGGQGQEFLWDYENNPDCASVWMTGALSGKWLHSISYRKGNTPLCLGFCGVPDHRIDVAWQTKYSVKCWSFKLRCNCLGKKVWASWPQPAVFQTVQTPLIGNSSLWTLFLLGKRIKIKSVNGLIHSKRFLWQKIFLRQKDLYKEECGSPLCPCVLMTLAEGRKRLDLDYDLYLYSL